MSANCDVVVIFSIYGQLEQSGSHIPDTNFVKLTFPLIVTFCVTEIENRTKKSLTQLSQYWLSKGILYWQKNVDFLQKMLTSAKLRGSWY